MTEICFHTYPKNRNEKLTDITFIAIIKCEWYHYLYTSPNSNFFVSAEMKPRVNVAKDKTSKSNELKG